MFDNCRRNIISILKHKGIYQIKNTIVYKNENCLNQNDYIIQTCGWHLSYFGDAHFIKNKLENFAHQEYNSDEYTNIQKIEKRINNNNDLFDRDWNKIIKILIKENPYLPPEYETYLQNFILF